MAKSNEPTTAKPQPKEVLGAVATRLMALTNAETGKIHVDLGDGVLLYLEVSKSHVLGHGRVDFTHGEARIDLRTELRIDVTAECEPKPVATTWPSGKARKKAA